MASPPPARFHFSRVDWIVHLVLFAAMTGARALVAQEALMIPRASGPIRIDGRPTEAAWDGATPLPLVMFQPLAGQPPSDSADVRVTYDDTYLFVAARFLVGDPADIRASSLARDRLSADDVFRILIDTFDDNENAVGFAVTPLGVQVDWTVSGDGQSINTSWNTYWDATASRDARGWYAEVRVPFSSLRFQSVDGHTRMGLIVSRYSARTNEIATYPALSPSEANATARPSLARTVSLTGVRSRRPVYVSPYALGGVSRAARLDAGGTRYGAADSGARELGVDAKYSPSSNVTLDLTVNTDFAQVEADDEQVNLSRFSLFFPEKRQFFLERAGVFDLGLGALGDPSRFFHSRRVGLAEDGRPLRIYAGTRVVGRLGDWDVAALDMQTAADTGGTENLGVLRVRRRVLNDQSTLGLMATSRLGSRGRDNVAYALDTRLRVLPRDYVAFQWAQSFDGRVHEDGIDAGFVRAAWERPGTLSSRGLAYQGGLAWSGRQFNPALGFLQRGDYRNAFINARYGFFPGGVFRVVQPSVAMQIYQSNADRRTDSRFVGTYVNYELKSGVNGWVGINANTELVRSPFELQPGSDVGVPAGRYSFNNVEMYIFPPTGRRLRAGGHLIAGQFYDGTRSAVGISPSWVLSEHIELSGDYTRSVVKFAGRGKRLDADIGQLRVEAALDTKLSVATFVQYNRAADAFAGNMRVRYRFAEGRDVYVVYNDRLNADRERGLPFEPKLPLSQERTLLVKYTHTFVR